MRIDKNYKIRNITPELSKQIQEICIGQGFVNSLGKTEVETNILDSLAIVQYKYCKGLFLSLTTDYFNKQEGSEISPQDFISRFGSNANFIAPAGDTMPEMGEVTIAGDTEKTTLIEGGQNVRYINPLDILMELTGLSHIAIEATIQTINASEDREKALKEFVETLK